jgi:hypothetical protein
MSKKISATKTRHLLVGVVLVAVSAFGVQVAVGASPLRNSEEPSPPAAPSTNGETPPEPQGEPYAAYVPPTGPLLSLAIVKIIARQEAQRDGDGDPSSILAASGMLLSALNVMSPNSAPTTPLSAMPDGERAAMEAPVYIIEMHGSFTLAAARDPRGESAPQGTVLRLLLDAHTGAVEGRSLGSAVQVPLQNLGSTEALD